jgi:hypothetical protein
MLLVKHLMLLVNHMRKIRSYSFAHDVDNIRDVQYWVIDNYDPADYNIHIATGATVMNHLTIYRGTDEVLDHLIDSCYGEGAFEQPVATTEQKHYNQRMDQDNNIWEQLETHMHENLGTYGLKMMDAFLELKERAEDCGMCPPDTPERQQRFEQMHG